MIFFHKESGKPLAHSSEGCPIPGNIQGQAGWSSEQCSLWEGIPCPWQGLEQEDSEGSFQPKPFCDHFYHSMERVRWLQNQLGGHNSERREEQGGWGEVGASPRRSALTKKAEFGDNPSVELPRFPAQQLGQAQLRLRIFKEPCHRAKHAAPVTRVALSCVPSASPHMGNFRNSLAEENN